MPGNPSGACAAPAYPAASVRRAMPPPSARCGGCRPLHPPPLLALCTPVVAAHNRRPSPMHLASTRAHSVHTATVITSPRLRAPLHRFCTSAPLHLCACAPLQGYPSAIAVPGALAGAATATAAPMVTVQGRQVGAPSVGAPSVTVAGRPAQVATATAVPPTYSQ